MQAERRPNQPAGSFAENFFSFRGHRCGGLCLLGQERHRPKEPPARRSLIDSSILTPTGEPAEPAVRNGGAAAISPRADDSECLGAKPVKPTPLCARAHNGETRGFSRNPRAITTTFETQLLQVVGGPGKLFLPIGAKTCFGGEAARLRPKPDKPSLGSGLDAKSGKSLGVTGGANTVSFWRSGNHRSLVNAWCGQRKSCRKETFKKSSLRKFLRKKSLGRRWMKIASKTRFQGHRWPLGPVSRKNEPFSGKFNPGSNRPRGPSVLRNGRLIRHLLQRPLRQRTQNDANQNGRHHTRHKNPGIRF